MFLHLMKHDLPQQLPKILVQKLEALRDSRYRLAELQNRFHHWMKAAERSPVHIAGVHAGNRGIRKFWFLKGVLKTQTAEWLWKRK